MLTKLSKNVVCIKNIPSNVIEEAFFILKSNCDTGDLRNEKIRDEILKNEIDEMIDEYTKNYKNEQERKRKKEKEFEQKQQKIRMKILICTALFALVCIYFISVYS